MPLTKDELIEHYPILYHMAEPGSWPSIKKRGLLSTSALLDLFEISGSTRKEIESCHRPRSVLIEHPKHGSAVIRDQIPMRESALLKCLKGMSARGWYELLNRQVFFWVTKKRVETLLNARAYRNKEHVVISADTKFLIDRYHSKARLSPINSGSTIYRPVERGPGTFRKIAEYPFEERKRLRGIANAIAEIAFEYAVPDLSEFVLRVERRKAHKIIEVVWEK